MKEEFLIRCIVNMYAALIAQNKTKISFFLCTNLLVFFRHKQKKFPRVSPLIPTWTLPCMQLWAYSAPKMPQLYTGVFIWITDQLKRPYFDHWVTHQNFRKHLYISNFYNNECTNCYIVLQLKGFIKTKHSKYSFMLVC